MKTLMGLVSHGSDTWLIDIGASKHMAAHKYSLSFLTQNDYSHKVQLGDDYQYPIKAIGESSYKLKSKNSMRMKEDLYLPSLKKNVLSIPYLDKKCFRVTFVDGEFLMWQKGNTIDDAIVIGVEEGGLQIEGAQIFSSYS